MADKIVFQIPGAGAHTIKPTTELPKITDQVTIDATNANNPNAHLVVLDGSMTPSSDGLKIFASGSTVRGMVVNNFKSGAGISVYADHVVVANNFVGTDASGMNAAPNKSGISMIPMLAT